MSRSVGCICLALAYCLGADAANLVENGSFEAVSGKAPVGWACEGDCTVVQTLVSDVGVTAGRCAKLACSSFERQTREGYATLVHRGPMALEKGKWYRFSCWARQEGMAPAMATTELILDLQYTAPYTTTALFMQLPLRRDWQRFEKLFQAAQGPCPSTSLSVYFDSTGTLWIDDMEIVEVPAPHPEPSHKIPEIGSRNLLPNAGFECGPAGWATLGQATGWGPGIAGLYGDVASGEAFDGTRALRIEMGPGRTPVTTNHLWPANRVVQNRLLAANVGWMPVHKGEYYTLSAYMRASRDGVPAQMTICFGAPLEGPSRPDKNVTLSKQWKRYSLTAPATNGFAFVAVGPDMTTTPDVRVTVWIDDVQFERSSTPTAFESREPVELHLYSERLGNVFDAEQPAEVIIQGTNRTALPVDVALRIEATDYFDRLAAVYEPRLEIMARKSALVRQSVAELPKGFYWLKASWQCNGRVHAETMRLAIIDTYPYDDSVFGVNTAPPANEGCRSLVKVGVIWARDWSPVWQHVEPEPGDFTFDAIDEHVTRVRSTGMRMMSVLPPFPSAVWASEAPDSVEAAMPGDMLRLWGRMVFAPKDKDAFGRFIETTVSHLQNQIDVFEYLNEPLYTIHSLPNTKQMDAAIPGLPNADYTVHDLVALLEVFHRSVKAANPNATTIGGMGARPDLLTKEFFAVGGLNFLDVFNLHIYPGLRKPEGYVPQMEAMLGRMKASPGGLKPVWITEYSYFGTDVLPWMPYVIGPEPWSPNRLLRDEKEAADYAIRFAAIMLAHNVERIFYHWGGAVSTEVNDDVPILESWMMDYASTPRKLYAAQSALANLLGPAPKFAAPLAKPESVGGNKTDSVYGYAFQCGTRAVLAAWAPQTEGSTAKWTLNPPAGAEAFDIMGKALATGPVELGESPVYLTSSTVAAQGLAKACQLQPAP